MTCIRACRSCARAAESALSCDPAYTRPGTQPYSEYQVALVSCASTCELTARALAERRGDIQEMCIWCCEVSAACAALVRAQPAGDPLLERACVECADACHRVIRGG